MLHGNRFLTIFFQTVVFLVHAVSANAEPQLVLHRKWVETQDADGWYPAKSTKGHFFIKSPIPFNDYTITTVDENIGTLVIHGVGSKSTDGYEFGALETVLTEKSNPPNLQLLVDAVAKKLKTASPNVSFHEKEGKIFGFAEVSGSNRTIIMRLSLIQKRLFNVMCDFPTEQGQTGRDICKQYIESFRTE